MSNIDIILEAVGFCVAVYWLFGFFVFLFWAKVYVHPGAPLHAKIITVVMGSWHMPWPFVQGRRPVVAITPNDDPMAEEQFRQWMRDNCPCPSCKRRRGE